MALYDLRIVIEELDDGSDYRYMASSPDLPNLIVAGETAEEVLEMAPQVAAALIASMMAAGEQLPDTPRAGLALPHTAHIAISVS